MIRTITKPHHEAIPPDVLVLADRGIPKSLAGWSAEPKLDGCRARVLADAGRMEDFYRVGPALARPYRSASSPSTSAGSTANAAEPTAARATLPRGGYGTVSVASASWLNA